MASNTKKKKLLDGNDLMYRLFQNLLAKNDKFAQRLALEMIIETSIWLPLDLYKECPVVLPWVVRDPKCRPHSSAGKKHLDRWGAPDLHGFQMDDNTLIKGIPKSLTIGGKRESLLCGKRMGKSFVASHIWREVKGVRRLASRHPELNSFVPNLVWLPSQISKLSDREGSIIQDLLKVATWAIYRKAPVNPKYKKSVDCIWKKLEPSILKIKAGTYFKPSDALHFVSTEKFVNTRINISQDALSFIDSCLCKSPKASQGTTGRYAKNLPLFSVKKIKSLRSKVSKFVK